MTAVTAALMVSGCVSAPSCGSSTQTLECRATAQDHEAQLILGIAVEGADPARAANLYASAAHDAAGTTYVYVPGVRGQRGYVMPVRTGPDRAGLPEAAYRLGRLYQEGRGVKPSAQRARKLMTQAARHGYAPAAEALARMPP